MTGSKTSNYYTKKQKTHRFTPYTDKTKHTTDTTLGNCKYKVNISK